MTIGRILLVAALLPLAGGAWYGYTNFWRAQHELVDPDLLGSDTRLGFLELGPALLIILLRSVAVAAVLLGAGEVARQLLVVDLELMQRAALLGIVLPA